ncbi:uncharacterized protein LOC142331650 [Lycorma delicatula]|uniref:uncharacterized protein LOC142331650 n=1 Tax=Lycorma delicatula TaxID=130591 RepID=UPI003F515A96
MPVVQRAFMDRSTETRKMAAKIIGNMYSLTDQKDLTPYLPTIIPGLKSSLLDPVPEVRSVSARALGATVRGMGETSFEDLLPWLMQTLTSETSSVDRSGAAQGLSEVVGGLGVEKLHKLMPEIISTAERADIAPHVKDGYIMMFIYMPVVFTSEFTPYIGQIITPILKALADENEYVRDTALKAGQRIVNLYADSAIMLLLPELEKGLFDDNWRIRYSSVQLLGDLLYRISGVSGKMSTETANEDDNFGTEQSHKAIITALGADRRNRVLAGLYMGRSDVSLMVRQAALHVWKVVVTNTPRTLREILPTLFGLLLGCLASTSYDKRQPASVVYLREKTPTAKFVELAKALGLLCIVTNCGEGMDYLAFRKILNGLCQCGAWGCFDEFNRIDISVISTQLQTIRTALLTKAKRFVFEGVEISIDNKVGVFVTMNPGYAGRTELPESVKALFRPVVCFVPDMEMICLIMLFSEGFLEAKILAKEIVTLYRLCTEQLSKQYHYDFGLRTLKSVLVMAGELKRNAPDLEEVVVLMRALRDINLPKFVFDDVPLFLGLIKDLFPDVDCPRVRYPDFNDAVEATLMAEGYSLLPAQEKKIKENLRPSVVQDVHVHKTTVKYTADFLTKFRRKNYVTPKHYLDFINVYKLLLEEKNNFIVAQILRNRLRTGFGFMKNFRTT